MVNCELVKLENQPYRSYNQERDEPKSAPWLGCLTNQQIGVSAVSKQIMIRIISNLNHITVITSLGQQTWEDVANPSSSRVNYNTRPTITKYNKISKKNGLVRPFFSNHQQSQPIYLATTSMRLCPSSVEMICLACKSCAFCSSVIILRVTPD